MSKHFAIMSRLDELENLKDGWLEGSGSAVNKSVIEWCRSHASDFVSMADGTIPYFYPTPEGGIQVEIDFDGLSAVVNVDPLYGIERTKE
jgi:hypothetical protein